MRIAAWDDRHIDAADLNPTFLSFEVPHDTGGGVQKHRRAAPASTIACNLPGRHSRGSSTSASRAPGAALAETSYAAHSAASVRITVQPVGEFRSACNARRGSQEQTSGPVRPTPCRDRRLLPTRCTAQRRRQRRAGPSTWGTCSVLRFHQQREGVETPPQYDRTSTMSARNPIPSKPHLRRAATFAQLAILTGIVGVPSSIDAAVARPPTGCRGDRFVLFTVAESRGWTNRWQRVPHASTAPDASDAGLVPATYTGNRPASGLLQHQRHLASGRARAGALASHRSNQERHLVVPRRRARRDNGRFRRARLVRLWAVYNECAMWCLLAFCCSGVYLWLSAQARSWWAWGCLFTGTCLRGALDRISIVGDDVQGDSNIHLILASLSLPFLLMYCISAVQMSHGTWFSTKPTVREQRVSLAPASAMPPGCAGGHGARLFGARRARRTSNPKPRMSAFASSSRERFTKCSTTGRPARRG